ncbi:MAG: protein translocase subunit SecDF, partial [Bacteroidota bacterium]|nr:protein translocase subunit SecDF [Bacteroidota bacterium]
IDFNTSDDEVMSYLKQEASSALSTTYDIINARIDKFGVTQPNIQTDETAGRIIVELPGVDDPKRVRKLLKGAAKLEFYETYKISEVLKFVQDADNAIYLDMEEKKGAAPADSNKVAAPTLTPGNPLLSGTPGDSAKPDNLLGSNADSAGKDTVAKYQPLIEKLVAGGQSQFDGPIIGRVLIRDTDEVNRMLAMPEAREQLPDDLIFRWGSKPNPQTPDILELYTLRTTGISERPAALTGDVVIDARQDIDPQQGTYVVSMQMNSMGAKEWAMLTKANAAKNPGYIAIVLDEQVYSAPEVKNEIPNGSSQITGNFTVEESTDLANVLKTGKLPVELDVINEAVVGPSLGRDNIQKGTLSLLIGILAVIVFMVLYYNRGGWVANFALLVNLFFIMGVLASLQAALTLPGMAGIVLTLGMAVDANVLIYERIREELRSGKGMRMAISEGFQNALSSILDGNITTLLMGIILMTFGSGPIYGFAVVLVIGILTSLFSSILISRLIFDWLLAKDNIVNFGNKVTSDVLVGLNFDFLRQRKIAYIISSVVILAGIISIAVKGFNYGIDFKGGYAYTVAFEQPVNSQSVRDALENTFNKTPEVKTFGSDDKLRITTDFMIDAPGDNDSLVAAKLQQGLASLNNPFIVEESQKVGSAVASDVRKSAFASIGFGLLVIFLYITLRFRRWQFAVGATIALAHDVLFVLAIFSIFKDILPFSDMDQSVVAALLTLVGFSINDTVVVFDRIREYLGLHKKSALIPTVNSALNTTMTRTIITSFTVFLVVLILFLFGGEMIRGFSFAMVIGVLAGTYSSIFIATPIAIDLTKEEDREIVAPVKRGRSEPVASEA